MLVLSMFVGMSAKAQLPDQPIVFDEFSYENATYNSKKTVRAGPEGTLFGKNTWTDGQQTWKERVWYRYDWWDRWSDENVFKHAEQVMTKGSWGDGLALRFNPGTYQAKGPDGRSNKPPQVVSGFAKRTGTWVSRINFADLDRAEAQGGTDAKLNQAFWVHTPFVVQTQPSDKIVHSSTIWDEINYEFNNYFEFSNKKNPGDPGEWPYMANGLIAGGRPQHQGGFIVPMQAPRRPDGQGGGNFTCKYVYAPDGEYNEDDPTEVATVLRPAQCGDLIGGNTRTPEIPSSPAYEPKQVGDIFSWLQIRYDGNELVLRLVAEGKWGHLDMKRTYGERPLPTQPLYTLFSQNIGEGALERPISMVVDWFYYTPSFSRPLHKIIEDVSDIRSEGIARFNTTGSRITSPYEMTCTDPAPNDPNDPTQPCDWPYQAPTNTFEAALEEPIALDGDRLKWITYMTPRQGVYRIDWQYRLRNQQGRVVDSGTSAWEGFRYQTPDVDCGEKLNVEATFTVLFPDRFKGDEATVQTTREGASCE